MSEHIEHPVEKQQQLRDDYETIVTEHFRPKYAGFWTRVWAYLIDLLVLSSISGIFIKPLFRVIDLKIASPSFLLFSPYKITFLILLLLYFALMTKYFQQTVGKMILGIKVVTKEGKRLSWSDILFREVIGRFISRILLIPYLLVVFMPKKEALHDLFADTAVIHEDTYEKFVQTHYEKRQQLQEDTVI